jgi:hypothetical protein
MTGRAAIRCCVCCQCGAIQSRQSTFPLSKKRRAATVSLQPRLAMKKTNRRGWFFSFDSSYQIDERETR